MITSNNGIGLSSSPPQVRQQAADEASVTPAAERSFGIRAAMLLIAGLASVSMVALLSRAGASREEDSAGVGGGSGRSSSTSTFVQCVCAPEPPSQGEPGRCTLLIHGRAMFAVSHPHDQALRQLIIDLDSDTLESASQLSRARQCLSSIYLYNFKVLVRAAPLLKVTSFTMMSERGKGVRDAPSDGLTLGFFATHADNLWHEVYAPTGLFQLHATQDALLRHMNNDADEITRRGSNNSGSGGRRGGARLMAVWTMARQDYAKRFLTDDWRSKLFRDAVFWNETLVSTLRLNSPAASTEGTTAFPPRAASTVAIGLFRHELTRLPPLTHLHRRGKRLSPTPWVASQFASFARVFRREVTESPKGAGGDDNATTAAPSFLLRRPLLSWRPRVRVDAARVRGFSEEAIAGIAAAFAAGPTPKHYNGGGFENVSFSRDVSLSQQAAAIAGHEAVVSAEGAFMAYMLVSRVPAATWVMYFEHQMPWYATTPQRFYHEPIAECLDNIRLIVIDAPSNRYPHVDVATLQQELARPFEPGVVVIRGNRVVDRRRGKLGW